MFYKRLKELRKEQCLSQDKLAELLNVSRQSYSRYENGISEPELNTIVKIADIFNVSLDYLLCRTNNKYNLNMLNKYNKDIFIKLSEIINEYEFTKK